MTNTNLPWLIFGRQLRPYALAVSLSAALVSYAAVAGVVPGSLLSGAPGRVVSTVGWMAVGMLWAGWWARSEKLMRWGLFWTTGVWATVTALLLADVGPTLNTALAGCWVVASGGAWLLEVSDGRGPREHE